MVPRRMTGPAMCKERTTTIKGAVAPGIRGVDGSSSGLWVCVGVYKLLIFVWVSTRPKQLEKEAVEIGVRGSLDGGRES